MRHEHTIMISTCHSSRRRTHLVSTITVHLDDEIPISIGDVLEANISEDTSIVDENIDTTKSLDCSIDDLVTKLDTVVVGNSFSTSLLDFINDDIRGL